MEAQPAFEHLSSEPPGENVSLDSHKYVTLSLDDEEGDGFFINPRSIPRMRRKGRSVMGRVKV